MFDAIAVFSGILLQMQPLDADGDGLAVRQRHHDLALARDRRFVLADPTALRQIGIALDLAVEHRAQIDLGVEAEARADRLADVLKITGSIPGIAASTSETWLLGSPPNSVEAPENSFEL